MTNLKPTFNKQKVINYWLSCSEDDFETMFVMYDAGRYSWALFIGHLVIEKLLKAYFVQKKGEHPPFVHNLLRLALHAEISVDDDLKHRLVAISAFNINARYDDYKRSFQKTCTPKFTEEWIGVIKDLRIWMLEQIKR